MVELSDVVKKVETGAEVVQKGKNTLLPILQEEDIGYHVNKVIEQYKDIHDAIKQKPYLAEVLREYVKKTVEEYKWLLYGAKTVDSIDRITAVIELGSTIFGPEAETGVKTITEPLELVAKIPYAAYYTVKSKDYVAPLYFAAAEATSLIPYLGEAVDICNIYTNRVRKQIQKKAAQSFLEKIVQG